MSDGDRHPSRRDTILAAAADLFWYQGYAATGVDDIGHAAGISGPAVYRHFETKNDLLHEVVRRSVERVVRGVADVVHERAAPWDVLEGLVDNMIDAVLEDRAGWAVVVREQRHLAPTPARALTRAHRLHVDEWVHALAQVRPDLDEADARVVVHGVLGLTTPLASRYDSGLEDQRIRTILHDMAMEVLRRAARDQARPATVRSAARSPRSSADSTIERTSSVSDPSSRPLR